MTMNHLIAPFAQVLATSGDVAYELGQVCGVILFAALIYFIWKSFSEKK
jgi:hypothetical protein